VTVFVVSLLATVAAVRTAEAQDDELIALRSKFEKEVRLHPDSAEARLSLAKVLHFRANDGDADAARRSTELLEGLAASRPDDPVVLAYLGSARLVAAKLAWSPWSKVGLARQGLDLLDRAVTRAPDDPEVRFLRGASTRPLPRFFGRSKLAADDLATAASSAERAAANGRLDRSLEAAIFYLYGFTRLDRGDVPGTEAAWRKTVAIAPESRAGKKAAARLAQLH